jgi:hypothetical protein
MNALAGTDRPRLPRLRQKTRNPPAYRANLRRLAGCSFGPLPWRALAGQLFQLGGEPVVPARRQVDVNADLQRGQPQFLQRAASGRVNA